MNADHRARAATMFLADWDSHLRNFVPALVSRIDFRDQLAVLVAKLLADGNDELTVHRLKRLFEQAHAEQAKPVADRLIGWLSQAIDATLPSPFETQDPWAPVDGRIVQWPTGIPRVDAITRGGYAVTVYGGSPKLGKSLAALGSALEAAAAGWAVVYVNAELTEREMHQRVTRYAASAPPSFRRSEAISNLCVVNANPGFTAKALVAELAQTVSLETDRILIVLDSINRLVELDLGQPMAGDYWSQLRAWTEWPRLASRLSDGRISVLIVSELNRKEQIKGGGLEYAANMVVRFTRAEAQDRVNIEVSLSRETPDGECGEHERDWRKARFVSAGGGRYE